MPSDVSRAAEPDQRAETIIGPRQGFSLPSLSLFVANRDLLYFLLKRDVTGRYKQTKLGLFWVVLQPAAAALVFSVFLGGIARVPSGADVPYPVFAITGLTLWIMFTMALARCSSSIVENMNIVSKVFFPRILLPVAAVLAPIVDFFLALAVAIVVMLIYGVAPSPRIVLVAVPLSLAITLAAGAGLWFAALNVKYRDVAAGVPVIIQLGLFITPIIYPASLVPADLQKIYALNPLVGIFELYRWTLFSGAASPGLALIYSTIVAVVLLVSGAAYFQRAQAEFADYI